MEKIREKVIAKYHELTNRQKIVAKFLLDEPKLVALYPAKEIGKRTQTSETTVIRLCYSLGYSGYSMLQEEIRKSFLLPKTSQDHLQELTKNLEHNDDILSRVMSQDIQYVQQMRDELDAALYANVIQAIIDAEKIIVIGLRTTYAAAHWLAYTLNIIKGDTYIYRGEMDDANYLMTEINPNWLVIALSFPRYVQETVNFIQAAKERGAKVAVITDDELSPVGRKGDMLIKVSTPKPTSLKGMPVVFSVMNALMTGVMAADSERTQRRIQTYQETSESYYSFFKYSEDDA
jgi:DNA-binding MurR/RpiR family transcriptional regulator